MEDIIKRLAAAAKEYKAIREVCDGVCGIGEEDVHLLSHNYIKLFPDYKGHKTEAQGIHIKVSTVREGVEFYSLFEPRIPLKDMI